MKLLGSRYYPIGSLDQQDPRGPPWTTLDGRWTPIKDGKNPDRRPHRGPYDESSQAVIDSQFIESHRGGIDYFACCWFFSSARKKPVQDQAINGMAASTVSGARFHIAFDSNTPSDIPVTSLDDIRQISDRWDELFQSPNYLRLDGRPVVDILTMDNFDQVVAPAAGLSHRALLDLFRERTGEDIYFGAGGLGLPHWLNVARTAGYNAFSPYNLFTTWSNRDSSPVIGPAPTSFAQLAANYKTEWTYLLGSIERQPNGKQIVAGVLEKYGLDYILPCTSGFDDRPWHPQNQPVGIATGPELDAHMREAMAFGALERVKMICIYAWNEFMEGGFIEPCYQYGRMKLGVIRRCKR